MEYSILADFSELEKKYKTNSIQAHELQEFLRLQRDVMILADYIETNYMNEFSNDEELQWEI